ncbi:MAG: DUF72 domain-containing protein [Thermoleophilia bacterium]|nr:DUF72 domain-containing protein [Thermoleophilia bacterium]
MTATRASVPGLYVGTSGFSYPSWRGGFYPADAKPDAFLGLYASRLPSVELNSTFYRLPSEDQFARWAGETPPGFRFAVTMSRRCTARGRVEGVEAFLQSAAALGDQLGPIRIKVPQERDDGFLLLLLGTLDPAARTALDFRHPSWDAPDVTAELDAHGVVRVNALEHAAGFRYLRFRDPPYDEAALQALADRIRPALEHGLEVYAYFRHEDEPRAPGYALRLAELATRPGRPARAREPTPRAHEAEPGG